MSRHIICWSGGKDSTATLILAKLHNLPVDEIITVCPDPFRLGLGFRQRVEAVLGVSIKVLPGPSLEDYFFMKKTDRAAYPKTIYGWPFTAYKTCARVMKWDVMNSYIEDSDIVIVGIAADEAHRAKFSDGKRSYLCQLGYTQKMSRELCEEYGLLNPLYRYFARLGCVRCPKQSIVALRRVKELEPEKWHWCLEHDHLSPVSFKPKHTFRDIDRMIQMQDEFPI